MEKETVITEPSVGSAPARSDDPAWNHGKIVLGKKNNVICLHCNKHIKGGGITRLKEHLAGVKGNVDPCKKVPGDVKWQMKRIIEERKDEKNRKRKTNKAIGGGTLCEEEEIVDLDASTSPTSNKGKSIEVDPGKKRKKKINSFFAPRTTPGAQISIRSAMASKEMVDNAKLAFANWWYAANIPFNASKSLYYQPAVDAILAIGPGFKAPSYHELRGNLLSKSLYGVREYLVGIKESWKTYGCSIMSDGWTNQKNEPIINFLVFGPEGTMFLKSIDASGLVKNAETLFGIFDEIVQEVGPENVVQFITDNEASYKAAGKRLQNKYGCFFWVPCAAHCIDLMLENFADKREFPEITETIDKAKSITRYIYNHAWVVNLMRKEFTAGHELCRPGITRFATNFLSLQCLLRFKRELIQMFTSTKWLDSRYGKSVEGAKIADMVVDDKDFWSKCVLVVKISEPLVKVLRLLDGDTKPTTGYLYDAIDRAKKTIQANLKNKLSLYMPYIRVIEARWDRQLSSPLHAAACFLNPGIFFRPSFEKKKEVGRGFIIAITSLVSDEHLQDMISSQMEEYKRSTGDFGMPMAIRQRDKLNPVAWWEQFGYMCPELQKFAIRILSQCCSATGCERNWSTFEFIHYKKRNRLEHKRLNDLVFVRYNLKLRERNIGKGKDALDPISLDNIDLLAEWVSEEPPFLEEEDLSQDAAWDAVEPPSADLTLQDDEVEVVYEEEDFDRTLQNQEAWQANDDIFEKTREPYDLHDTDVE